MGVIRIPLNNIYSYIVSLDVTVSATLYILF